MTNKASPSAKRTFIPIDLLQPGDVVLTGEPGIRSRLVSLASGGQYSHVALYVGPALLFESQGDGIGTTPIEIEVGTVQGRELRLWDVSGYRLIDVFRIPDRIRGVQPDADKLSVTLMSVVTCHWGKEYPHLARLADASVYPSSLKILLRFGLAIVERLGLAGPRKFAVGPFCSELVADCFERMGWAVFRDGRPIRQVAPNTFADPNLSLLKKLDVKIHSVEALPSGRTMSRAETSATMFNELNLSLYGRAPSIESERRLRVLEEFFRRLRTLEDAAGPDVAAAALHAAVADLDSGPLAAVWAPSGTTHLESMLLIKKDGSTTLHVPGRGTWSTGPEPETGTTSVLKSDAALREKTSSALDKIADEVTDRQSVAQWLARPPDTWRSSAEDVADQADQAFNAGNFVAACSLFAAAAKLFDALHDGDNSSAAWLNLAQCVFAGADTERAYLHARDLAKAVGQRGYLAGPSHASLTANACLLAAEAGFYASEFVVKGEAWENLVTEALRVLTVASLHFPATPEPQLLTRFVSICVVLAARAHGTSPRKGATPIPEAALREPLTTLARQIKRFVPADFEFSGDVRRTQQARQGMENLCRRYGAR